MFYKFYLADMNIWFEFAEKLDMFTESSQDPYLNVILKYFENLNIYIQRFYFNIICRLHQYIHLSYIQALQ